MRLASRRVPLVVGALVVAALALAPAGLSPFLVQFLINLFMLAALAESWNIIGGFTGYASFGNVAFFGIGAYTTGVLLTVAGGPSHWRWPRAGCWPWRSPD
jgi:ABC-type branched-chain amino acid transport system, permease component